MLLAYKRLSVALLIVGSAILLVSCKVGRSGMNVDMETFMSHQSDTLTMVNSVNGKIEYRFYTPLMERYEFAREPYMEFRRGIDVTTYDSIGGIKSTLVADYAIFFEKQELWEAKGNVVATNEGGQKLETQQLFWNQKTKKVYSNVDSKVTQPEGDVIVGEGFESDDSFDKWMFRKTKGKVYVDADNSEKPAEEGSEKGRAQDVDPGTGPLPAAKVEKESSSPAGVGSTPEVEPEDEVDVKAAED